ADDTEVFRAFLAYPFDTDAKFQQGLKTITAKAEEDVARRAEDIEKAKWFFYSKFVKPFDYTRFQTWRSTSSSTASSPSTSPAPPPESEPEGAADGEPRYPRSFHELCEMVARGEPIPGIRTIPDKLNDAPPSVSVLGQRRKPWEVG
ncbi:hypothetical protein BDK51DRAFT_5637, partial [Blyttiomyces helicus]